MESNEVFACHSIKKEYVGKRRKKAKIKRLKEKRLKDKIKKNVLKPLKNTGKML